MYLILALHNIRSTYNVGAILRSAEGFGVAKVILSGWTPATKQTKGAVALPHVLEKTTAQIAKTALGAEELLTCEWSKDIAKTLDTLHKEGSIIFGLENNISVKNQGPLSEWRAAFGAIENNQDLSAKDDINCVLVLGEEVDGIDDSLFDKIDWFLEIPMVGQKESFNVSVAAGIALYEMLGKSPH